MRILSKDNSQLLIRAKLDEIGIIEQGLGLITGAYKVDIKKEIGTTEEDLEIIRKYLRNTVDKNPEYNKLRMSGDSDQTYSYENNFSISTNALSWVIGSLELSMNMAGREEFQTLTGYAWEEAEDVLSELRKFKDKI